MDDELIKCDIWPKNIDDVGEGRVLKLLNVGVRVIFNLIQTCRQADMQKLSDLCLDICDDVCDAQMQACDMFIGQGTIFCIATDNHRLSCPSLKAISGCSE
jgi:hypothetical protein